VGTVNGYRERAITYAGPRVEGGRLLKEYLISATEQAPSAGVVEAGRASVARSLAASAPPGAAAFSVIHEGEDACYYLAYWWAEGCILHGHAESAPLDAPDQTAALWPHAIACTWELVPVAHESQAWVRHVLKATAAPDLDQWASDGWSGSA
jgi:hypothetical protein